MTLLLDIGNTRIKWAQRLAGPSVSLSAQQALSLLEWRALMADATQARAWLLTLSPTPPAAICVSNVAGAAVAEQLQAVMQSVWQRQPEFVNAPAQLTLGTRVLRNAYREPHKLGVDRWLALIAAAQGSVSADGTTHSTVLVVSVGTAMTLDVMSAHGQHEGGLIVPGPQMMVSALLGQTSDIATHAGAPRAAPDALFMNAAADDASLWADNTQGCVVQGARQACVALIAASYARLQAQGPVQLWLTGGAAPSLLSSLTMPVQHVPELVLRGLAIHASQSAAVI